MTAESHKLPVPRWLTRAEKSDFRRLEALRYAAGKPVLATEIDALCDLVSARSRLLEMRRIWRRAIAAAKRAAREEDGYSEAEEKFALSVARQIDAAAGAAQRMARRLGLASELS